MIRRTRLFVFAAAASLLAACNKPSDNQVALLDAAHSAEQAPEQFRVRFETTRGPFVLQVHRAWSPWGVDRFYYLVKKGFYDNTAFFRVIPGYIAQFGINGNPAIAASWSQRFFPDDTVRHESNLRGRVTFANAGPQTRVSQLFINLKNNPNLDHSYGPIGEIVEGMAVIDSLYSGYGDGPPMGRGPDQNRIFTEGASYLKREFPKLDYITSASIAK